MNLLRLKPFIDSSCASGNHFVKCAAEELSSLMQQAQQAEEVAQPTLHRQESNKPLDTTPKDEIDKALDAVMPDVTKTEKKQVSQFGKAASAYACDIEVGKLPKATQEDIKRFAPSANGKTRVVQYGMVESELTAKVDAHNFKQAESHIAHEIAKKGKRSVADAFQDKVRDKYILLLNDSIVDGHHFLAMAKALGVSCSLKVLDLTPIRFQKTAHSLLYVLQNNSRKTAA